MARDGFEKNDVKKEGDKSSSVDYSQSISKQEMLLSSMSDVVKQLTGINQQKDLYDAANKKNIEEIMRQGSGL